MAGGSANNRTTGRAITPNITVSREPRCSVRSTRALARRPTAATVIRIAPMGISHAVRVDRYSEVRPADHTNQNSAAQAPITRPAPTRAGLQCRFIRRTPDPQGRRQRRGANSDHHHPEEPALVRADVEGAQLQVDHGPEHQEGQLRGRAERGERRRHEGIRLRAERHDERQPHHRDEAQDRQVGHAVQERLSG